MSTFWPVLCWLGEGTPVEVYLRDGATLIGTLHRIQGKSSVINLRLPSGVSRLLRRQEVLAVSSPLKEDT